MRMKLRRRPDTLTGDAILDHLRLRMPGPLRNVRANTMLADLAIDSLDLVDLLCLIDEEFDVRLEQAEFEEFRTIGELADAIARATAHATDGAGERGRS